MRLQGGTEGETEGDRGKKTVWGCHPCHAYLSPANPGILLVVTLVTPVSCQRRRLSSKIDNLPRWRAQQFFRTKPPPYLASGTLHEQRYPHCRSVVSDEFSSPSEPNFRLFCEERLTSHERKPRISAVRFEFADTP